MLNKHLILIKPVFFNIFHIIYRDSIVLKTWITNWNTPSEIFHEVFPLHKLIIKTIVMVKEDFQTFKKFFVIIFCSNNITNI